MRRVASKYPKHEFAAAKWIWIDDLAATAPQFVEFSLSHVWRGGLIRFHISADQRFILKLNGVAIVRGPDLSTPSQWSYSSYEIDLPPGHHVWTAFVWWLGEHAPMAHMSVRPGFLLAGEVDGGPALTTGLASWRATRLPGFSIAPERRYPGAHFIGPSYRIDLGVEPASSTAAVSIASAVTRVVNGRLPGGWLLAPSELPAQLNTPWTHWRARAEVDEWIPDGAKILSDWTILATQSRARSLADGQRFSIPPRARWSALLDTETIFTGYSGISLRGGRGSKIDLSWAESLGIEGRLVANNFVIEKGDRDEIVDKRFFGFGDSFVASDSRETELLETPWWRAGRYLLVRVEAAEAPIEIEGLQCVATGYPVKSAGTFQCDDSTFNRILELCENGFRACCHEIYHDCPTFEQMMYSADARIEALVHRSLECDARLTRKAIALFSESRFAGRGWTMSRYPTRIGQVIPSFSLIWVLMVEDYYMWHGDESFVRTLIPGLRQSMDQAESHLGEDGWLCQLPGWGFVDWCKEWSNGAPPADHEGRSTPVNLFYLLALQSAVRIERAIGSVRRAEHYEELASRVATAVEKDCRSGSHGLYGDFPGGKSWSEHSQILAVLALGASREEKRRHLLRMRESPVRLAPATYYFAHYLFEACQQAGDSWLHDRLQPWRELLTKGVRTPIEADDPCRSDCHAWASHPLFHAYASIGGIRPLSPGLKKVKISPLPGKMSRIDLALPVERGAIRMHARFSAAGAVEGEVVLPDDTTGAFVWNDAEWPLNPGKNLIALHA